MSRILLGGFDCETTGLDQSEGHRLIEVALHVHDLAKPARPRVGRMVQRINPERGIDPDAEKVHGIKFEDLVREPTWDQIAPKLSAVLAQCRYVVAHNGEGFDLPFVFRELIRAGQPVPKIISIDTLLQGRWATPDGAVPSLKALCFACGVPYDTTAAHAADYDVDVMLKCFFSQLDRGFFRLPTDYYELPPLEAKKAKK